MGGSQSTRTEPTHGENMPNKYIQTQFKESCHAKETNRTHRNFTVIQSPILSINEVTVERKKLPF